MEDNMIAPTKIRKPENWQDFEKLCKKLWGEIWDCKDTIQRNGRSGQNQNGVDVYGLPKNQIEYYGIQCKGKDDYTNSQLSKDEIDIEIAKALKFIPKLKRLIFATTANKDASIEEYIRQKNIEHKQKGLFEVYVSSWEDIVDLLEERRDTFNWYNNHCQYKDLSDVDVFINESKQQTIRPQYIRTTKHYSLKPRLTMPDSYKKMGFNEECWVKQGKRNIKQNEILQQIAITPSLGIKSIINPPRKIDKRWCTINIKIENIGNTPLRDYKLYLCFDSEGIDELDDKFRSVNYLFLNDAARAQINADLTSKREVFKSSEYRNVIEFKPLDKILVQTDYKIFKIGVKPKDNIQQIRIEWSLKSQDYRKDGFLFLMVDPQYEDKNINIEVEDESQLKEDEIIIEPKIIER
jgi:hypothetical protein